MRLYTTVLFLLIQLPPATAQRDSSYQKIYKVNTRYELPAAAGGVLLSMYGFRQLEIASEMTASDVAKLDASRINSFDRPVTRINPSGFQTAETRSDLLLNISLFSPLLLALDKDIRRDWLDLFSIYLATHAADNAVYFLGGFSVRRARPLTYNPLVDLAVKTGTGKSSSFFSGHTSFSAAATFFMAKVYTDYHHIQGWNRVLVYTAAAIPPALVGYYRIQAGKHFKTDVIVGLLVGASSGILVPELHKNRNRNHPLTVNPYYGEGGGGLAFTIGL